MKKEKVQGKKIVKKKKMTPREEMLEHLKLEVAKELGLTDKIKEVGWGGLNAIETGRIGGLMNKKLRHKKEGDKNE